MRKIGQLKGVLALAAAALLLTGLAGFQDAAAYFTTYVSAGGSEIVRMGSQTELIEDVTNMTKHISILNTSQTNDCYVRVKIFHGSQLDVTCSDASGRGNLWHFSREDGYWYYEPMVGPGAATEILDAKIGGLPPDFDRDSFNVVVIQECTPVVYDEAGNPTADWNTVYSDYRETGGEGDFRE